MDIFDDKHRCSRCIHQGDGSHDIGGNTSKSLDRQQICPSDTPADMTFMRQPENQIFEYGDWVSCEGRIMYVRDNGDDAGQGKLGLLKQSDPVLYDNEWYIQFPEIVYYPIEVVQKLPEVDVDETVMRQFFRLEVTPWELCEQGLFPFSENSGTFTLTEEDIKVFASNLANADFITMDEWKTQFTAGYHVTHVHCPEDNTEELSLHLIWNVICDMFTWFDIDEDEPEVITDIIDAYFASKGKALSVIDASDDLKAAIISCLEEVPFEEELTEEQKKAYVRFLDEMCAKGNIWALEHKAYAYYGGNRVVPCDWKISEQTLLILEQSGNDDAANSLGYIYYSDRLGEPDYDKAFFYFSKAAKAGIAEAGYKLADLYRKGHGTAKDPDKAFILLKQVYDEQLAFIQDGYYGCKYADVALRMGYCYEEGSGCRQDYHKAHAYFLLAKCAIDMRILESKGFGDEAVKRNIENSLERIKEKDPDEFISITDSSDLPGSEHTDIIAEKLHELLAAIDYLYSSDSNSEEYDPFKDRELINERKRIAQVHGIILNEEGYVTYPAAIFDCIKEEVTSLNWRVSNVECGMGGSNYTFPFEDFPECFVDGEALYEMLQAHPEKQWWWGVLSGFPKTISGRDIKKKPVIDVQMETPYLEKRIKHIDPDAVLEIIAFDSTETYVIADSEAVIKKLKKKYPKAESLEKYVD